MSCLGGGGGGGASSLYATNIKHGGGGFCSRRIRRRIHTRIGRDKTNIVNKKQQLCRSSVGVWVPEDAVQWVILGGIVVSCAISSVGIDNDDDHRMMGRRGSVESRSIQNGEDEGFETAVRWSVMSVLSCLPFVNFMAWVFAALDRDDGLEENEEIDAFDYYYWVWAGLYLLPYVYSNDAGEGLFFPMDGFRWLCVGLGVLHVQLERMRYYNNGVGIVGGRMVVPNFGIFRGVFLDEKKIQSGNDGEEEEEDLAREIQRDLDDFDTRLQKLQKKQK